MTLVTDYMLKLGDVEAGGSGDQVQVEAVRGGPRKDVPFRHLTATGDAGTNNRTLQGCHLIVVSKANMSGRQKVGK